MPLLYFRAYGFAEDQAQIAIYGNTVSLGSVALADSERRNSFMAFYHDPNTGERVEVRDPLVREPGGFSMVSWIVLAALLIVGGTMLYHYLDYSENERIAQSTIDHPVTSPSDPNSSAVRPAPSPNPGP